MSNLGISSKKNGLTYTLEFKISSEIFQEKMVKNIEEFKKNLQVTGYRKGMVPNSYIESNYKNKLIQDTIVDLSNDKVNLFLKENEIILANPPKIKNIDDKKDGSYNISVSIEVFPEIPEIDFKKLKISFSLPLINEDVVNDELSKIIKQISPEKKADEGKLIENGDVADIYFKGYLNGEPMKNGHSDSYRLEIGSNSFINGFEEQLIGHKKNDNFDINVTFPENYQEASLSGKDVKFEIKINEIYQKELLDETSEETAKKLGFESIEKIKGFIKNNKENYAQNLLFTDIKESILTFIQKEYCDFEVPQSLLEKEIEVLSAKSEKKKEKEIEKEAKKMLCFSYLFFHLIKTNNINCEEKEVEDFLYQQANYNKISLQDLKKQYKEKTKERDHLVAYLKENKLISFIIDESIKDIKYIDEKDFNDNYLKNIKEKKEKIIVS